MEPPYVAQSVSARPLLNATSMMWLVALPLQASKMTESMTGASLFTLERQRPFRRVLGGHSVVMVPRSSPEAASSMQQRVGSQGGPQLFRPWKHFLYEKTSY
jgi:hypothetical protein